MNEYWNQFSYSPFCYVWDPIEEIHVISNMVSELQWSSPPLPPPLSPSYDRFLRPARRGFKRCRRSTTARLSSFTFSDLIADFGDNTTDSSSPSLFSDSVMSSGSCSSFSDSMVMVSDSLMVQESFVKVEDEDSILHPPVPLSSVCFDSAIDETVSEKTLDHLPVSFFADREIKIPAWKPTIDLFVFGTFCKGYFVSSSLLDSSSGPDSSSSSVSNESSCSCSSLSSLVRRLPLVVRDTTTTSNSSSSSFSDSTMDEAVPEKILEASSSSISVVEEAIASDSVSTTDLGVASSLTSHLSFFADQDVQFPAWKPATNAYVFGNFSEGVINLGADSSSHSSCLMKNSVTQQIEVPLIIDQFFGEHYVTEVTQILLSIKEIQLSWLGLWNFSFNWKNYLNLLLEIDGSWICSPSVCGKYSEIVNLPKKLSFDPGGSRSCTQAVCKKVPKKGVDRIGVKNGIDCIFVPHDSFTASSTLFHKRNQCFDQFKCETNFSNSFTIKLNFTGHALEIFILLHTKTLFQGSFFQIVCKDADVVAVVDKLCVFGSVFNDDCSMSNSLSACSYRDFRDSEFEEENAEFLSGLSEAKVSEQLGFPTHERLNMLQNLVQISELGPELEMKLSKSVWYFKLLEFCIIDSYCYGILVIAVLVVVVKSQAIMTSTFVNPQASFCIASHTLSGSHFR